MTTAAHTREPDDAADYDAAAYEDGYEDDEPVPAEELAAEPAF